MASNPEDRGTIRDRQQKIQSQWKTVQDKAAQRRNRLEEAFGHAIFQNNAKTLVSRR